jgi:epoxyqueuosine reductase
MRTVPLAADLRACGLAAGLDAVEVASAEPFVAVRSTLEARKAAGLHGGMAFTYRNPARSTDPAATVGDAGSLVVGARSYLAADPGDPASGEPAGRVARYAWSDHYAALAEGLGAIAQLLRDAGWQARVVVDDNALVDRAAAHRAGIGWWGKNANLLVPGSGSWFVLGSVITDAVIEPTRGEAEDRCGSCTRCLDGCPTGAITAPGVVDARRCLAWLLQADGSFPRDHRVALGDRIYGCDECQEVCPPNRRAVPRPASAGDRPWVSLLALLEADDDAVLATAGRWYVPKRDARYLRRTALVVLGNVGDGQAPEVVEVLRRYLSSDDPLLRGHAVWAARRTGRADLLAGLAGEQDAVVLDELAAPVEAR